MSASAAPKWPEKSIPKIVDPHTAIAFKGYYDYLEKNPEKAGSTYFIIVATAHPSKFGSKTSKNPDLLIPKFSTYIEAIDQMVEYPEALIKCLEKGQKKFNLQKSNYELFRKLLNIQADKETSITLIGMPGTGKSVVSQALDKMCSIDYLELDRYIEQRHNGTLFELLEKFGEEKFSQMEEQAMLDIVFTTKNGTKIKGKRNMVISPGGSVIYHEKGMAHL